jgi:hypothetical protein
VSRHITEYQKTRKKVTCFTISRRNTILTSVIIKINYVNISGAKTWRRKRKSHEKSVTEKERKDSEIFDI